MDAASIKIFLPTGRPDGLRTAEISNWTGKAIACPRAEMGSLFNREELKKTGIYMLLGEDPESGERAAYIGEAEIVGTRLKIHQDKDFWIQVIVFVSKDENLTKAHVKFLEGELIKKAQEVGKAHSVETDSEELEDDVEVTDTQEI